MRTAKAAVIVPVYNTSQYIRQCVDSILLQDHKDFELVLVDDGSTDSSPAICDEYAAKDDRVKVIHKKNGGLMSAWMNGVRESTAPYLFFTDGDDWISQDALSILTDKLSDDPQYRDSQIVCAGYLIEREWNHTSQEQDNAALPGEYTGDKLTSEIKTRLLGNEHRTLILSRCMKLFSRKLIEDNMHFCDPAIRMGEDVNITVPAILDAKRLYVCEKAYIYHYRFVHASMVHKYDVGLYDNIKRLCVILHGVMSDKTVPNGHMQVEREFIYLFLLVLKNEIRRSGVPFETINERIVSLCRKENSKELIEKAGALHDPANRLLASIMKHPDKLHVLVIRKIFELGR